MGRAFPLFCAGLAFVAVFAHLVINEKINFQKLIKTTPKKLPDIQSRMGFVVVHLTPGIAWIVISMCFVAFKRLGSPAIDPLYGYEKVVQSAKNNLTNSVEQFLMLSVSQLILAVHLSAKTLINVIPALNICFIIGRITFWLGYPRYRSFGFVVTQTPIMASILYNIYKYIKIFY